ncbi:hypothetical protein O181_050940 [Austropuccinia psidii MF-1]|uniref:Eisosome component PIL1-domain-containing protein n=1 Tax=Austropuccinia psidii MF-1 TaxID=1389203 RepID=A0A9Q3HRC1_9BASI|nr:hypothetical protein [Austropuccinia psidii MF-1]
MTGNSKRAIFGSYLNQLSEMASINNLRQVHATYDPRQSPHTLKIHLLIKAQKGLSTDLEALARDSQIASKQLYLWSIDQSDQAIKDVGDRLAYLTYRAGDIQQNCARALDNARTDLKKIRNTQNDIIKMRDREKSLENQLAKLHQEHRPKPDTQDKIINTTNELSQLQDALNRAQSLDRQQKRRCLQSSYHAQFQALRELGEKLSIISGYGDLLLDQLDDDPLTDYNAHDRTAWIKGAASVSLTDYQDPLIQLPQFGQPPIGLNPDSSLKSTAPIDTRLFAETHHHVLVDSSGHSNHPPSATFNSSHLHSHLTPNPTGSSLHPAQYSFNNQTTSIPPFISPSYHDSDIKPSNSLLSSSDHPKAEITNSFPIGQQPTKAEIGGKVPLGTNGPAHGSLADIHPGNSHAGNDDQPPAYNSISDKRV